MKVKILFKLADYHALFVKIYVASSILLWVFLFNHWNDIFIVNFNREIARMLADDYKKRVMIVDTSNEIGGDGDIPHAGIGSARRLQVPDPNVQHKVYKLVLILLYVCL